MKNRILAVLFTALLSTNSIAAIISTDLYALGDNLLTQDSRSGLEWLDLTETNNMTFNEVSSELGTGGMFEGWRYATNEEVVSLWNNFDHGVDLSENNHTLSLEYYYDRGIVAASNYLGNIYHEYDPNIRYGVTGLTVNATTSSSHTSLGGFISGPLTHSTHYRSHYYTVYRGENINDDMSHVHTGSYLVREFAPGIVPVPAAVWLFISGLIGLVGFAKIKGS